MERGGAVIKTMAGFVIKVLCLLSILITLDGQCCHGIVYVKLCNSSKSNQQYKVILYLFDRRKLKARLGVPAKTIIGYEPHDEAMARKSSMAKTKYSV